MFTCETCSRSYGSQSTFTRHCRNHDPQKRQHVCGTCGARFTRRDLLNRHESLHLPTSHSGQQKKLVAIACQPCRLSKLKCDAKRPCSRCQAKNMTCIFRPQRLARRGSIGSTTEFPDSSFADGPREITYEISRPRRPSQALFTRNETRSGSVPASNALPSHLSSLQRSSSDVGSLSEQAQQRLIAAIDVFARLSPDPKVAQQWIEIANEVTTICQQDGQVAAGPAQPHLDAFVNDFYIKALDYLPTSLIGDEMFQNADAITYLSLAGIGAMLNTSLVWSASCGSLIHKTLTTVSLESFARFSSDIDSTTILGITRLQCVWLLCFGQNKDFYLVQQLFAATLFLISGLNASRSFSCMAFRDSTASEHHCARVANETNSILGTISRIECVLSAMDEMPNTRPLLTYIGTCQYCSEGFPAAASSPSCTCGNLSMYRIKAEFMVSRQLPLFSPPEHDVLSYTIHEMIYEHCYGIDNGDSAQQLPQSHNDGSPAHPSYQSLLERWRDTLIHDLSLIEHPRNRTLCFNALLSCYLAQLRLYAPLRLLQSLTANLSAERTSNLFQRARVWASTSAATRATDCASALFALIKAEMNRAATARAKINLFGIIALHRAAVVIWVFAGCHRQTETLPRMEQLDVGTEPIAVCQENAFGLIMDIAQLCKIINPDKLMKQWFAMSAWELAMTPFAEVVGSELSRREQ